MISKDFKIKLILIFAFALLSNSHLAVSAICDNDNICETGETSQTCAQDCSKIIAGIYPYPGTIEDRMAEMDGYVNKLLHNFNGISGTSFHGLLSAEIQNAKSKGFMVIAHVDDLSDPIRMANIGADIIIFDEFKGRNEIFSGSDFNNLKEQIKSINPKIEVGIVENGQAFYEEFYHEGAQPDIIGLELYLNQNDQTSYTSYDAFIANVKPLFPNAKTQLWINRPDQVGQYYGMADYITLFDIDNHVFNASPLPLENAERAVENVKDVNVTGSLVSSQVSASASNSFGISIPKNAIDGDSSTTWNSGGVPPQWIELDLGVSYDLYDLRLLPTQTPEGVTVHKIYAGDTPNPTNLVYEFSGYTKNYQWINIHFQNPVKQARYVRIVTTQDPSWVSWYEVNVYAKENLTCIPNETNACIMDNSCAGTKTCNSSGSAWGSCIDTPNDNCPIVISTNSGFSNIPSSTTTTTTTTLPGTTTTTIPSTATIGQLQTILNGLIAQLKTLILAAIARGDTVSPTLMAYVQDVPVTGKITRNWYMGQSGDEVKIIQTLLAQDASLYPKGKITGYFGALTKAAVRKFQIKYGIPNTGNVGPLTRTKMNSMLQ